MEVCFVFSQIKTTDSIDRIVLIMGLVDFVSGGGGGGGVVKRGFWVGVFSDNLCSCRNILVVSLSVPHSP